MRDNELPKCSHRAENDFSVRMRGNHAHLKCNYCGKVAVNPVKLTKDVQDLPLAPEGWSTGPKPATKEMRDAAEAAHRLYGNTLDLVYADKNGNKSNV